MSNARTFASPGTSPVTMASGFDGKPINVGDQVATRNGQRCIVTAISGNKIRCKQYGWPPGEWRDGPEFDASELYSEEFSRMSAPGTSPGAVHSPGPINSEPVEMSWGDDVHSGDVVECPVCGNPTTQIVGVSPKIAPHADMNGKPCKASGKYVTEFSRTSPSAHALARAIHEARTGSK